MSIESTKHDAVPGKKSRKVLFGTVEYDFPSDELRPLRDSSDIANDGDAMNRRLAEDGYLYLPGFLDREEVLSAREQILKYMEERGGLEPDSRPLDGVMGQYGKSVPLMGEQPITHRAGIHNVLAAERLYELHERIQNERVATFEYKWLRAVGHEQFTGCHMDYVYMGRGSKRLMTTWIPLADIPVEQGTLCICPGSNHLPSYAPVREGYGSKDVDRDKVGGWFSRNPKEVTDTYGGHWLTRDVYAGDIITFGMHLLHASTTNTTDRWRLSCDVRFQPASEPMDPRWSGDNPAGHRRSA